MHDRHLPIRADHNRLLTISSVSILVIAIVTRIYLYSYHKDFWIDESMLACALYNGSWTDILQCKLEYTQCCPLFFALLAKAISPFSYTQYTLYFLPTCAGIALCLLIYAAAVRLEGKLYALLCCFFMCILKMPVYYSSEFKQYIFEGCLAIAMLFIFIRDIQEKHTDKFCNYTYPLLITITFLCSNTSIFISAGIVVTIALYLHREQHLSWKNLALLFFTRYSGVGVFILLYYVFYLKNGNSPAMRDYWKEFFFPTTLAAWPSYLKTTFIPLITGLFEIHDFKNIALVGLAALPGTCLLWRKERYIALALVLPFLFAGLAAFHIYPPGSGGMLGARLSFYLLPSLILLLAYAFVPLVTLCGHRIKHSIAGIASCCVGITLAINSAFIMTGMGYEQIRGLIPIVYQHYGAEDALLIYSQSVPAWRYYAEILDNKTIPYTVLSSRLLKNGDIRKAFPPALLKGKKHLYILYSHYPYRKQGPYPKEHPQSVKAHLTALGYPVTETVARGAVLHTVYLQPPTPADPRR